MIVGLASLLLIALGSWIACLAERTSTIRRPVRAAREWIAGLLILGGLALLGVGVSMVTCIAC
jgi:hypothetical protein